MDNNLEVKNLCKKYDGFELKNINIELPKGMILGLIGENGAGKTTTIKSILNLIKSNSGEIKIFGLNVRENEKKVKEDIIYDHRVTSVTDATLVKYIVNTKYLRCRGRRAERLSCVHSKIYRKYEVFTMLQTPRGAPLMRLFQNIS